MKYIQLLILTAMLLPSKNGSCQSNWTDVKSFDNNGNVMSQSRTYMDALGRTIQQQFLDISKSNVLANQPVFDAFGRPVLQTLSAPLFQNAISAHKDKFIEDGTGNNYSWDDFDKTNTPGAGGVDKPNAVKNTSMGSLGWYYSNNNTAEPYVPASSFPYSRIEYYSDPLGRVKRMSSPGDALRMGNGHEQKIYYMSNAGELFYVFGYKGSAIIGLEDNGIPSSVSENLHAGKMITMDEDGKVSIEYQTLSGLTIAICQSGVQQQGCLKQKVSQTMYYRGERGVNLHLPPACNGTLKFTIPADAKSHGVNDQFNGLGTPQIDYKITDLSTGKLLVAGTDYTLNRTDRSVKFATAYNARHLFLRVSFEYIPGTNKSSDLAVSYELDYDYWSLTLYDKKGQPVRTVPPGAINCGYNPLVSNSLSTTFQTYDILQKGPAVNQLLNSTPLATQTGMTQHVVYSVKAIELTTGPGGGGGGVITTSRSSLSAASADGEEMDNFKIVSAMGEYGTQTRQQVDLNLTDPDMVHIWGKVALTIELYGTLKNTGSYGVVSGIPKSTLYLQAGYWFNPQKLAIPPNNVTVSPYPGWEAHFSIPDNILSNYSTIELRVIDIRAITPASSYPYDNSGSSLYGEQLIANSLIDKAVLSVKLGVTEQLSSYPTPNPYNLNLTSAIAYNQLGWPVKSVSPDEGEDNFIYDTEGKLRFKQNAQQLANGGLFSYFVYDRAGRIVETGEFNPNLKISGPVLFFEPYTASGNPPNPLGANSVHTVIDISQAGWLAYINHCTQQTWFAYDQPQADFPATLSGYSQQYQDGQMTKSWNSHGTSWYGYDDDGRTAWITNNINDLGTKTINYSYTKEGQLDKTDYQKEAPAERFVHQYIYDADKRLIETKTSANNTVFTRNQALKYYLHGALKRNELGGTLQGIDYVFTINDQLKSLNDPTLTSRDPGKDGYTGANAGFKKDIFGFTLDYYPGDYVRKNTFIETYSPTVIDKVNATPEPFNGNIRAMRWQTVLPAGAASVSTFATGMLQYLYKYDDRSQLSEAIFGTSRAGSSNGPGVGFGPSFTAQANTYRVNNLTYDKTGNIKSLKRQGKPTALAMDDLNYNYQAALPDRLTSITDNAAASTYADDLKPQVANNYVYNSVGQLIQDITSGYYYGYNLNGNVVAITKPDGSFLSRFEYNASGLRQKKTVYDNNGNEIKHIWYVYGSGGELMSVYETYIGSNTTLQTELPVYGNGRIGIYDRGSNKYIYEISDHLGNVRTTIRDNNGVAEVLSFTDYYPHGSPMPGRNFSISSYRFGYQGQEKDPETGFSNFELRQYDGRLGRWFNPDPLGQHHSPYLAMGNNFTNIIDPTGGWDSDDGYMHHMDGVMDWMDEFGISEFDREHFAFVGGPGGAHTADGGFYSNQELSYDAMKLYYEKNKIEGITGNWYSYQNTRDLDKEIRRWNNSFEESLGWLKESEGQEQKNESQLGDPCPLCKVLNQIGQSINGADNHNWISQTRKIKIPLYNYKNAFHRQSINWGNTSTINPITYTTRHKYRLNVHAWWYSGFTVTVTSANGTINSWVVQPRLSGLPDPGNGFVYWGKRGDTIQISFPAGTRDRWDIDVREKWWSTSKFQMRWFPKRTGW